MPKMFTSCHKHKVSKDAIYYLCAEEFSSLYDKGMAFPPLDITMGWMYLQVAEQAGRRAGEYGTKQRDGAVSPQVC